MATSCLNRPSRITAPPPNRSNIWWLAFVVGSEFLFHGAQMNLLEFIASVVGSTAWPLLILALVLVLRRPLLDLLTKISSFKYKELRIDFENRLARATDELRELPPPPELPNVAEGIHEDMGVRFQVAKRSPDDLIFGSWRSVERELKLLAERAGMSAIGRGSALSIQRYLVKHGLIPKQAQSVLDELRSLRNLAAHYDGGAAITTDQAERFSDLAEQIVEQLRSLPLPSGR